MAFATGPSWAYKDVITSAKLAQMVENTRAHDHRADGSQGSPLGALGDPVAFTGPAVAAGGGTTMGPGGAGTTLAVPGAGVGHRTLVKAQLTIVPSSAVISIVLFTFTLPGGGTLLGPAQWRCFTPASALAYHFDAWVVVQGQAAATTLQVSVANSSASATITPSASVELYQA